jgi:hypothetical protein
MQASAPTLARRKATWYLVSYSVRQFRSGRSPCSGKEKGNDVPLQRRMRQFHSGGSTVSGPPLLGQQAPRAATAPQPDPMVALMALDGSTLTAREVSVAVAATAKMRTVEEATTTKATEEAAMAKVAADKAVVEKVAADKAAATKAIEEAMAKAPADAAMMKTVGQGSTTVRTTMGSMGSESAPLLAQRRDPRGRLRRVARVLLPSSSTMLENPGTKSNCVVAIFLSLYSYCI